MAELIRVYPENPATKTIEQAIAVLKADGIVVVPTDTVYSFACDLQSEGHEAVVKDQRIKTKRKRSIVFDGLRRLSQFTRPILFCIQDA